MLNAPSPPAQAFAKNMDLPLDTIDVWQIEGEIAPRQFLHAISPLLFPGDIVLFGCYEPTESMQDALVSLGATTHSHIDGFCMCFDINRQEHPDGCAFRFTIPEDRFESLLRFDDQTLSQKDNSSFYDHILAFRPGIPQLPLFTFHDAACGGDLYFSGHYAKTDIDALAARLSKRATQILNPVLQQQK